ncbi:MAG TPA: DinB family protein [Gemmatimonadaceae bacterium]|nr:DinB family protein [Gemmatimonadaceae bacterium]
MHARTAELLGYLDQQSAVLRAAYDAVPAASRGLRPAPGRWSPAEVVQHVALVERRLTQRIAQLVQQARALPPERDRSPVLPSVHLARVLDRTRPITASEAAQPRDADPARVWGEFEDARAAARELVVSADGLALGAVSAPHPVLGDLNGYGWIAFVGAHAARHAAQIREIAEASAA